MSLQNKFPAIFALLIASLIWGATPSVMKQTLYSVPLFSLAFIRFSAAALILLPFMTKKLFIGKNDYPLVFLSGLFGISIHIAFFFWGLKLTTALNAGIIVAALPLFTLFFAHIYLKEKVSNKLLIGALLGMLGIGIIIGKDFNREGLSVSLLSSIGNMLILISTLMFVLYELLSKKLFKTYAPSTITFYSFVIGALTFLPGAAMEYIYEPRWFLTISPFAVGGIIYGIFLSSLTAYLLWQWGLSKVPASRVGFFFYLDPIFATFAAFVILSESITVPFIIGTMFIFAGLFLAEGKLPYHHIPKLK